MSSSKRTRSTKPCWHPEHRSDTDIARLLLKPSVTCLQLKIACSSLVSSSLICQRQQKKLLFSWALLMVLFWQQSAPTTSPCNFPGPFSGLSIGAHHWTVFSHEQLEVQEEKTQSTATYQKGVQETRPLHPSSLNSRNVFVGFMGKESESNLWNRILSAAHSKCRENFRSINLFNKQAIRKCLGLLEVQ